MIKRLSLCVIFLFVSGFSTLSHSSDKALPLQPLLNANDADYPVLHQVMQHADKYKVQILYTQIDRDALNQPHFTRYEFNLNNNQYFYPASTVKLPIALLALEWLQEHQEYGITAATTMLTDSASEQQSAQLIDLSIATGLPNISHYIKKILLVSDNDASNRLYELLGQDYINTKLAAKGFNNSIINHRLSLSLSAEDNRRYNPIRFVDQHNKLLYSLAARTSNTVYRNVNQPTIGTAYITKGQLINRPMSFTDKNRYSLSDFDSTIKRLVFPQQYSDSERFKISAEQREFMLCYMSMLPPASKEPKYDAIAFAENYSKFLMFGGETQSIPNHIKIFNKTGWAYGHVIDGAYIVDIENNIEFFISAVIYANENGVLNDDNYQAESISLPFLNQLGRFLYQLELTRVRKQDPDLTDIRQICNKIL